MIFWDQPRGDVGTDVAVMYCRCAGDVALMKTATCETYITHPFLMGEVMYRERLKKDGSISATDDALLTEIKKMSADNRESLRALQKISSQMRSKDPTKGRE